MTWPAAAVRRARAGVRRVGFFAALLAAVGIATVGAMAASNGSPLFALAPVGLVAFLYGLARAPLRWSAAALLFLVLSLDITSDASGLWHTPLAHVGDLLQNNLELAGIPGVFLSGIEVVALYLVAVAAVRRRSGSTTDGKGVIGTPSVLRAFLLLYVAGALYAEALGLARGGGAAIWKLRHLIDLPLLFLLFQASFRGPADHVLLGRIVVLAACVKTLLAVWVQRVVAPAMTGGPLMYATNHGDSVLFSLAAFILVMNVTERWTRRSVLAAAVLLPVVLVGLNENARRTAWVMLAMTLGAAFLLSPPRPWKRKLARTVLVAAPILALYVAIGWNRSGTLFHPVEVLRTLSDSSVDSSTRWREVENWNLAMSIRQHPIAGLGLGFEYTEFARGDDISSVFADFKGWPHNSVLGLLLFAGPFGFTAIWSFFGCVVFLAVRSYRMARAPDDRIAALACMATVIVCAVLAFGDTGAHHAQYRTLSALSAVLAGKLAVVTGAWPAAASRSRRRAAADGDEGFRLQTSGSSEGDAAPVL